MHDGIPVTPVQNVRDLGIYVDGDLSMRTHVQRTTSSCFAAFRQLRQIRRLAPTATFQTLTVALVNQRLDYGNSTLVGIPAYLMRRLQLALNAAARLIFHLRRSDHITDALVSLHWLRVPERIQFKIAVLTHRVHTATHHGIWGRSQNRKYMTYCNAAKRVPSNGNGHCKKLWEFSRLL